METETIPYSADTNLKPFQLAMKVMQGYRPSPLPNDTKMKDLIINCWKGNAEERMDIQSITQTLKDMSLAVSQGTHTSF